MKSIICQSILKHKVALTGCILGAVAITGCNVPAPDSVENTLTNSATNSATNVMTPTISSEVTQFFNMPTGLKGKLKENYVGFSLDYPASWELREDGRNDLAQNFVKIERSSPDKSKGKLTLENLTVGFFKYSSDSKRNAKLVPETAKKVSSQFSKLPQYKKISEGPTKIGDYSGYEFRFTSLMKTQGRGDVQLWGRVILLMQPKTTKGVALLMLASSLAPEIKSPADIGVKGELPAILKSFKFKSPPVTETN